MTDTNEAGRSLKAVARAKCDHPEFIGKVEVTRLTDSEGGPVTGYTTDLTVACAPCGQPFRFLGLPMGMNGQGAAMSADGITARLAITPATVQNHPLGSEAIQ